MIQYDEPIGIDLRELKPMRDWLVVERCTIQSAASTLVVPEMAQKKLNVGVVIRIGPGRRFPDGSRRPMQVRVGDVVHWQSSDIDTKDLALIQEADILGIECPN